MGKHNVVGLKGSIIALVLSIVVIGGAFLVEVSESDRAALLWFGVLVFSAALGVIWSIIVDRR